MSADFWLGLQQDWDLWHALRSAEATEIARLTPFPRASIRTIVTTSTPLSTPCR